MHEIYKKNGLPYLTVKLCPNCNELVPVEKELCPSCFYNFSSKEVITATDTIKISNSQMKQEEEKLQNKKIEKEKIEETKTEETIKKFLFCECCGAKINEGQIYCGECGTRVSKIFCKHCREIIDSSLLYCQFCGTKQDKSFVKSLNNNTSLLKKEEFTKPQEETLIIDTKKENNTKIIEDAKIENIIKEEAKIEQIKTEETKVDEIKKEETKVEETSILKEVKEDEKTTTTHEEIVNPIEIINRGRKRFFVCLQIFMILIIASLLTIMPLVCNNNFFSDIIVSFKNFKNAENINGYDYLTWLFSFIQSLFTNSNMIEIATEKYNALFVNYPLIGDIFASHPNVTLFILISLYSFVYLTIIISLIASVVMLFTKRSFKSWPIGLISLSIFLFSIITILKTIVDKQEIIVLYLFVLSFLYWFVVKIVFLKENKKYKRMKLMFNELNKK